MVYDYITHGLLELNVHETAKSEYKQVKTLGEGILFLCIGIGYIIATIALMLAPRNKIPYLVILIGTIAVIFLYFFRIFGIPVIGTEHIIVDSTTDISDVITKIPQIILLIPISMLYIIRGTKINKT